MTSILAKRATVKREEGEALIQEADNLACRRTAWGGVLGPSHIRARRAA
ncbi:MAG: hypothetical protein ACXWKP_22170 [Bradyrhizobium sp.]